MLSVVKSSKQEKHMSNERQRIQLDLNRDELEVLEVALTRYANDRPDTEGYNIALSIRVAVHNAFYREHYHSLIRSENGRLGYIPCRLCSERTLSLLTMVQHVRYTHHKRNDPPLQLHEAMALIYSWYKGEGDNL